MSIFLLKNFSDSGSKPELSKNISVQPKAGDMNRIYRAAVWAGSLALTAMALGWTISSYITSTEAELPSNSSLAVISPSESENSLVADVALIAVNVMPTLGLLGVAVRDFRGNLERQFTELNPEEEIDEDDLWYDTPKELDELHESNQVQQQTQLFYPRRSIADCASEEVEKQQQAQDLHPSRTIADCTSSEKCPDLDLETLLKQKKITFALFNHGSEYMAEFEAFLNQIAQKAPLDCSGKMQEFFSEDFPDRSIKENWRSCTSLNSQLLTENDFSLLLDKDFNQLPSVRESLEILRCREDDPREKVLYAVAKLPSSASSIDRWALSPYFSSILPPLSQKYDVRYQAVSDVETLCKAIQSAAQTGTLAQIYIDGHGDNQSIDLGGEKIYSSNRLPDCFSNLKKDGIIVLVSCETGGYSKNIPNLARSMANKLQRIVVAPYDSILDRNLRLLQDGSIYHSEEDTPLRNSFKTFHPEKRLDEKD